MAFAPNYFIGSCSNMVCLYTVPPGKRRLVLAHTFVDLWRLETVVVGVYVLSAEG